MLSFVRFRWIAVLLLGDYGLLARLCRGFTYLLLFGSCAVEETWTLVGREAREDASDILRVARLLSR